tara:strand:- start:40349 stop:41515 length:1167 start_codon:yes stop_codon:yes gene_type:complete
MAKGWEVHGGTLRVYFYFNGEKCRESLGIDPTAENKRYAEGLVATIKHEIKAGTFDYSRRFPNSAKLKGNTVAVWLDTWLQIKARQLAPSTILNYRRWVNGHIRPRWGNSQADKIDSIHVEDWIANDLKHLSNKSIKEIVSLMNQVFTLYRQRNKTAFNPVEGIKVSLPDDEDPDPFTRAEIDAILKTKTTRQGEINFAAFSMWSGPRPSESMALGWDDVDLDNAHALLQRAIVAGQYKATKTKRSKRKIDLLKPALEALRSQYQITGHLAPITIDVLQRDNRTTRKEQFRPVFINTRTGSPYTDIQLYRQGFWVRHLAKAEVRFRGPVNCRHTFASQALTAGLDLSWIMDQMGHTSEAMLRRKYSKYIREDERISKADLANKLLGLL